MCIAGSRERAQLVERAAAYRWVSKALQVRQVVSILVCFQGRIAFEDSHYFDVFLHPLASFGVLV